MQLATHFLNTLNSEQIRIMNTKQNLENQNGEILVKGKKPKENSLMGKI